MDIPYNSAFVLAGASALPSTSSFHHAQIHETLHLQHQKVQESIPVQGLSVVAGGKREISNQQWEEMKPLIQRVYIKENKPFRHLKNILRAEYGVEPTGHQFSRKVTEWGIRKNVSCSERRKILQNPRTQGNSISELQGQRVNSAKLQNWRKRYREEEPALSLPLNALENSFNPTFGSQPTETEYFPPESDHPRSEFFAVQDLPSSQTKLDIVMRVLEPLESGDQSPFSWSTVNVPGSPGLSRFFAALELEESSPVPELSLSSAEVETSQTASATELSGLFNEKNKGLVYNLDIAGKFQRHNDTFDYRKPRRAQIPWRDLNQAFMGWDESPLTKEVYIFPASVNRNTSSLSFPRRGRKALLEYEEAYLIDRLHKLEASILPNHRGIIATKEALADIYEAQYRLEEALDIFHETYQQKRRIWGPTHVNCLRTRLRIADVLLLQDNYKEGLKFIEDVVSEIEGVVSPEHELAAKAALKKGCFLIHSGNIEEAERIYRQSLQMSLNNYGPKDRRTLRVMRLLGVALAKGDHTHNSGAEKLLRTTIQIYKKISDSPEAAMCGAAGDLGWILRNLELYDDSYQVGHDALRRFEASLGPQHHTILKIRFGLGQDLCRLGKFEASEMAFRDLLALEPQFKSQGRLSTVLTEYSLAHVLWKLNRVEEAISLYKRALRGGVGVFGPGGGFSWVVCEELGSCYEEQERVEDAVELYQQMIKMLQRGGFPDHPAIAKYTMRIERLTTAAGSDILFLTYER